MSYNYDANPWDDNYSSSTNQGQNVQQQQQQPNEIYPLGNVGSTANTMNSAGGLGSTGYSSTGYNNPAAAAATSIAGSQYAISEDAWNESNQQQQQQLQPAQYDGDYSQQYGYQQADSQRQQQQQQSISSPNQPPMAPPPPPPSDSALKRFLRAHVPLCGPCMDLTSTICTPVLDTLLKYVNRDLLVSKIFYFFFYSAFGSLFPLMGVYFKQLGMNPAQVGILTGVRPFIEIFSAPFWSGLAERFQKGQLLLLFSLISWILFTHSLAGIRPPASACIAFNDTDYVLYIPYSANDLSNVVSTEEQLEQQPETATGGGSGGDGSNQSNEMFMNKMPTGGSTGSPNGDLSEQESKDRVLAAEENESVQGSRRRRRRRRRRHATPEPHHHHHWPSRSSAGARREQVAKPSLSLASRFAYSIEGHRGHDDEVVDGERMSFYDQLGVDLDNDFNDVPYGSAGTSDTDSGFDNSGSDDDAAGANIRSSHMPDENYAGLGDVQDPDGGDSRELDQSLGKSLWRYRRATTSGSDYEGGESSDGEPESRPASARGYGGGRKSSSSSNGDEEDDENAIEQPRSEGNSMPHDVDDDHETRRAEGEEDEKLAKLKQQREEEERSGQEAKEAEEEEQKRRKEEAEKEQERQRLQQEQEQQQSTNRTKKVYRQRHKTPPTHIVGMSPITVQYAVNYNKEKHSQFVTPMFSTIVYKLDDIKEVFFLLLLLISLGEFFSAPAITIADSITLQYLGENTDLYGRQRTFGSIGWAITLMLVGMALDNSTSIEGHPCGPHQRERNYSVCFTIFSLLMGCAFITATQFTFYYSSNNRRTLNGTGGSQTLVTSTTENDQIVTTTASDGTHTNVDDLYASTRPREIFNTAPPVNAPPPQGNGETSGKEKFEFLDKWKSAAFAQRTRELPEWVNVFRQFFRHPMALTYLFITWFLGCGVGLVFTFLFWHLQDVGGTPTLFGICSVINHISEVLAYFFSSHFIKRFGHTRVSIEILKKIVGKLL